MKQRLMGVAVLLCIACGLSAVAADKIDINELIAKHLDSIGKPDARAAKSRFAQGTVRYEILTGGAGKMDGKATLVSEGDKFRLIMRFGNAEYRGEDLLTDGNKVQVVGTLAATAFPADGQSRSQFGTFLYAQSALITEGLFGGSLSTAWPLLDPKLRGAKLTFEGLKKIDGEELYEVKYQPKKSTDLEIHLYFDKDFRHVMTVASALLNPQFVGGVVNTVDFMNRGGPGDSGRDVANARQQPTRFKVTERFSGFRDIGGLTLPTESVIKFTAEGYTSSIRTYTNKFEVVESNVNLPAANFQFK